MKRVTQHIISSLIPIEVGARKTIEGQIFGPGVIRELHVDRAVGDAFAIDTLIASRKVILCDSSRPVRDEDGNIEHGMLPMRVYNGFGPRFEEAMEGDCIVQLTVTNVGEVAMQFVCVIVCEYDE